MNTLAAMPAHNEDERIAKVVLGAKRNLRYVLIQNAAKMRQEMRQKGD